MIISPRAHALRALLSAAALLAVGFATLACGTPEPPHPADTGGSISIDVKVGECLTVGGTDANVNATPAPCGSTESTHKVAGKAPKQEECANDVNVVIFEQVFGVAETGALCLDVDWAKGQCYKLGAADPAKTACAGDDPNLVKIGETLQGATDESGCPNGGILYPTRKFVVCTEPAV